VEVDGITFRRPVNVGDLIRFRSWVLRSWPSQHTPGKGVVHVQVEASVTQPEKLQSEVTNQFGFRFIFDLRRDQWGTLQMPRQVLPGAGALVFQGQSTLPCYQPLCSIDSAAGAPMTAIGAVQLRRSAHRIATWSRLLMPRQRRTKHPPAHSSAPLSTHALLHACRAAGTGGGAALWPRRKAAGTVK
jgi:hypothetical protein